MARTISDIGSRFADWLVAPISLRRAWPVRRRLFQKPKFSDFPVSYITVGRNLLPQVLDRSFRRAGRD